jgi:hypothetical protein
MTTTRIVFIGLLAAIASTSGAMGYPGCAIEVFAYSGRPPGIREGYIEIRNRGAGYCRVEVERHYTDPDEHISCPGCENNSLCGEGIPLGGGGYFCQTFKSDTVVVNPCDDTSGEFCKSTRDCFPNANAAGDDCCDHGNGQEGHCNQDFHTGSASEFCAYYPNILVRLTGSKSELGDEWTETDQVVCARGFYLVEYPGSALCPRATYCDVPFAQRSGTERAPCPTVTQNCM